MNLILSFVALSMGTNLDLKCKIGSSDYIYLRDSQNVEKTVRYKNKKHDIEESISLKQWGFISLEKDNRVMTMIMQCKKIK